MAPGMPVRLIVELILTDPGHHWHSEGVLSFETIPIGHIKYLSHMRAAVLHLAYSYRSNLYSLEETGILSERNAQVGPSND